MIFPGAGGPELDKMASDKVKKDIGTFITFGLLVEAAALAAHYFGIDGVLV